MKKKVPTTSMSYEEWKAFRRTGIGSSDIATILGLIKWKTPRELFNEKVQNELAVETQPSARMKAGIKLEKIVAEYFMEETGKKVRNDNVIRLHPDHPEYLANLDRVIIGDPRGPGILECKTTSSHYLRTLDSEFPPSYYAQVQWQLFVTGWTWACIAMLVDGYDFKFVEIARNEDFIEKMVAKAAAFWECVKTNTPPPAQVPDIEKMMSDPEKRVEAENDDLGLVEEIESLQQTIKKYDSELREKTDRLKLRLEDAEVLIDPVTDDVLVTYKTTSRKGYTVPDKTFRTLKFRTRKES